MAVTVQNILDQIMEPVQSIATTIDTLKFGEPEMEVTGIVTTFMATHQTIQQAIEMAANLLITHEGLFYSHHDHTDSLENKPVYKEKLKLIKDSKIAIFRCHDYIHRYQPDGIMTGLVQALGWQEFVEEHQTAAAILTIPHMSVRETASFIKKKLGIEFVRITGDLSATCTRIGILAGYRGGGALTIPLFEKERLDLIIYGEGPEWETPEYVRDCIYQGKQKAIIAIGHAESEEPGMKYLAEWIKTRFPSIPVSFIPQKAVFEVF